MSCRLVVGFASLILRVVGFASLILRVHLPHLPHLPLLRSLLPLSPRLILESFPRYLEHQLAPEPVLCLTVPRPRPVTLSPPLSLSFSIYLSIYILRQRCA